MSLINNPIVMMLVRILIASVFIIAIYFLTKYLSRLLDRAMSSIDRKVRREIEDVIRYIIYVIAALIAIGIISPEVSILTTLLLLLGLALIVAFSDSLRSWGSQYSIRGLGFVKLGDWIEVEGYYGRMVEETGSGIILETPKRERIFIPNNKLVSSIVVNRTTQIGSIHTITFSLPKTKNPIEAMEKIREILGSIRPELASDPEVNMKVGRGEYEFEISMEIMNANKISMIQEEIIKKTLEAFPEAKVIRS
ncbi:MAG: mechanosensitive ion channel domain-containing protein [Fervidicoccaceae archaeon]